MNELDQHFTPEDVAHRLTASVVERFDPDRERLWVEPSVGDGAFLRALVEAGVQRKRITTIDIDKDMSPDECCDFLTWEPWAKPCDRIVIGNPPFGRSGKKAHQFVDHALTLAPVCCFVMPLSSFTKPHNCAISLDGVRFSDTTAKCCWLEYYRGVTPMVVPSPAKRAVRGFEFVSKDDDYDLVIQRCGSGLGKVTKCNGTGQGKYYLKMLSKDLIAAARDLHWYLDQAPEIYLTTHQPSLSQQALIKLLTISYYEGQHELPT